MNTAAMRADHGRRPPGHLTVRSQGPLNWCGDTHARQTAAGDPSVSHPRELRSARHVPLTIITALLPVVAVNACYVIASQAGHVPVCLTYVDGCTSISATGRYGVTYWLFKLTMLPVSVLLVLFWSWLARERLLGRAAYIAGITGAAFLVLYIVFLGTQGDVYRLMRRYGVFVYFLGTFIAQIAATRNLGRLPDRAAAARPLLAQRALLFVMLLLGLAEVPLGTFGMEDDRAENIIEWNFALLMQLWFLTWIAAQRAFRPGSAN